jgi:four helix bundle protein
LAKIKSFEELLVWQDARKLTADIYKITRNFPTIENYGLSQQIRRAAVSVMSNIAEGFERSTDKDYANFLSMARGSVAEIQNDLYIALDLKYIDKVDFNNLYSFTKKILKQLSGFIHYLKNNDFQLKS